EMEVISHARANLVSVGLEADVLVVDARGLVIGAAARPDTPWPRGRSIPLAALDAGASSPVAHVDSQAAMLFGEARLPGELPPWRIVVAEPLALAFAPVRRTVSRLGAALGGTLVVALGVALFAARRT